ncbi:MAG: hypothetical protein Q7W05_02805 [Deltaproteobacteria bacterium]|nr:hypothetical protein [Deltaproteobacteria bacterium]
MNIGKFLKVSALLLVLVLAVVGCGKKENPFAPVTDAAMGVSASNLINSGAVTITPGLGNALNDLDGGTAGVQAQIIITFPVNMNAGTVNFTNIKVDGIQDSSITYYPELKKAVIYGTWSSVAAWVNITLTTGLQAPGGGYIDGNGNDQGDGVPYDNMRYYVRVGAPATPAPDIIHPALTDGSPYGGSVNPIYPQFYCRFDANDMDSNLVRTNFSVKDSTGRSIALKSDGTNWTGSSWYVYFRTTGADSILVSNAPYTVNVNLNNLKDTSNPSNKAVWMNYGYVANIPNAVWPFRTSTTVAGDYTPLRLTGNPSLTATEMIIAFNDSLDMATAIAGNIIVYKTSGGTITGAISGRIYTQPSDISARQVRFTLENAKVGSGTYRLYLNRQMKDNAGLMLDGNGNNIGGEAGVPGWDIPTDDISWDFSR